MTNYDFLVEKISTPTEDCIGNGNSRSRKLSDADVARIRELYKGPQHQRGPRTGPSVRELAKQFGCGKTQISRIVLGQSRTSSL